MDFVDYEELNHNFEELNAYIASILKKWRLRI